MSVVNNDNDKKNKTNTNIQSGSNQPNLSLTTPLSKDLKKYESNESDKYNSKMASKRKSNLKDETLNFWKEINREQVLEKE